MNLVDSSGWLEYFANGKNADFFAGPILDSKNLIVSAINIYEVFKKVLMERDEADAFQAAGIMQQSRVIDVNSELSLAAAKLSAELKLPMADSLILSTGRIYGAVIWTQDSDFKNLPNVRYIKPKHG